MGENVFICFNAQCFATGSRSLILDKGLELFECFVLSLLLKLFNVLLEVFLARGSLQSHNVLLHAQLLQMFLDVLNGLLVVGQLLLLFAIVAAEVASVEHVILERVEVVGQRLQVMGPDEPLFLILVRHRVLNVLQIVVGGQVQSVAGRYVVVH